MENIKLEENSIIKLFAVAEGYEYSPVGMMRTHEKDVVLSKIQRLGGKKYGFIEFHRCALDNPICMKGLSPAVVNAARFLRKHSDGSYIQLEALKALKFIELSLIYAFYQNQCLHNSEYEMNTQNMERDFLIEKSLGKVEKIWNILEEDRYLGGVFLSDLEDLSGNLKRVLKFRYQTTEIEFFKKNLKKAITILKGYLALCSERALAA